MQSPLFMGIHRVELESVDSTNLYAANLLKEGSVLEGTVIMAHTQSHGKGQRGNTWLSQPGKNLTLSFILYPRHIRADRQFLLTQCVSLAVIETLKALVPDSGELKIKWPNDIYYSDKKAGGILIENTVRGENLGHSIIGIGLNINQGEFDPALTHVTSLKALSGREHDLQHLLNELCRNLESFYLRSKTGGNNLGEKYQARLFRLNSPAKFIYAGKETEAVITGTDPAGRLMLVTHTGEQWLCSLQEIKYVL